MKKCNKDLSEETVVRVSNSLKPGFMIEVEIECSGRKREHPAIDFFPDDQQYFDPATNSIHIGIYGPLNLFDVKSVNEYVSALDYLKGHEMEHYNSTASAPYKNGIERGISAIIDYIAAKEGIKKHFRNFRDYEVFAVTELPKHNIYVHFQALTGIVAGIMNSVEDGRIERKRSNRYNTFAQQRRYFRGRFWDMCDYVEELKKDKPLNKIDANDKLCLLTNNILMLATTNLYMKDFLTNFHDTQLMDEVKAFMPSIANGIMAKRTRKMADNVVDICKQLAPYIYDVARMSDAEVKMQKLAEEIMKQLITQSLENMPDTSEIEEDEDDGIPCPVFPQSQLVVTLPDDVYDKLMEKMKKKNGSTDGAIMVQREHPKEEDENEKKNESEGNDSGAGGKKSEEESKKDGSGSGSDSEKEKENEKKNGNGNESSSEDEDTGLRMSNNGSNNSSSQNGSEGKNSSSNESGDSNQNSSSSNGNNSSDSSNQTGSKTNEKNGYDKKYEQNDGGVGNNNNSKQGSHKSGLGGTEDMVHAQMEEAAKACQYDAEDTINTINQSVAHTANTNRTAPPTNKNCDKPMTAEDVKGICDHGFKENRREYKLDQKLPTVLAARAKAFRKKNERYFKSLSTPNITNLDSGSVDPSLIFGLAMGETNVFRKIGEDKKFNGCVYVLIDNSGSMSGHKRMEACKAAAVIEEGFKGLVPMKMVAFDYCGSIIHEVVKGFDESQKLNCCWNFAQHGRNGGGNDDGKDILIAQKELLMRPEEKKLLIVLSDGAPASVEGTKQAIAMTRKKGIEVFGIYFEDGEIGEDADYFKEMYQKDYVCCKLNEVDNHLTRLMMKFSRS